MYIIHIPSLQADPTRLSRNKNKYISAKLSSFQPQDLSKTYNRKDWNCPWVRKDGKGIKQAIRWVRKDGKGIKQAIRWVERMEMASNRPSGG